MPVDLFKFEVVAAPELGITSSHRVGGFQQVVTEETIAGLDELGVLGFQFPRLVLSPDKALRMPRFKPVDHADFDDDTDGVDLADAGNGSQRVGDDLKLLLNVLVQNLDLLF